MAALYSEKFFKEVEEGSEALINLSHMQYLSLLVRKVDGLNSIDGNMYPSNQPKPNFGELRLTQ